MAISIVSHIRWLCLGLLCLSVKASIDPSPVLPTQDVSSNLDRGLIEERKKELYFFIGPHQAGASSIIQFFARHASNAHPELRSESMKGWVWPDVDESVMAQLKGDVIPSMKLLNSFLGPIQKAWGESEYGVILGSEVLDQVHGDSKLGLIAMRAIVDALRLRPQQVYVVMNYRSPRLDQFSSLWKHAKKKDLPYTKVLCEDDYLPQIVGMLDTSMNPLFLATVFREELWNVNIMDIAGVLQNGLDMAHVLACEIMDHNTCENGWLQDRQNVQFQDSNEPVHIQSMNEEEEIRVEKLFEGRDCYYKDVLENDDGVNILYKETLWRGCAKDETNKAEYEKLADVAYLVEKMRESHAACPGYQKPPAKIEEAVEELEEMVEEIKEDGVPVQFDSDNTDDGFLRKDFDDDQLFIDSKAKAAIGGGGILMLLGICILVIYCRQSANSKKAAAFRANKELEMQSSGSGFRDFDD